MPGWFSQWNICLLIWGSWVQVPWWARDYLQKIKYQAVGKEFLVMKVDLSAPIRNVTPRENIWFGKQVPEHVPRDGCVCMPAPQPSRWTITTDSLEIPGRYVFVCVYIYMEKYEHFSGLKQKWREGKLKNIKASRAKLRAYLNLFALAKIHFIWQCEYMCDHHECWRFKNQPAIPGPFQLCFYFTGPHGDCWEQVWSSSLLTS